MQKRAAAWIGLLALTSVTLFGCAYAVIGGAAAGGTYAYVAGWLHKDYNSNLENTYEACLATADDLGLVVEKKSLNLSDAYVRGKKGDETIIMKMESLDKNTTKVSVRVGVLGDEAASKRVHETISNNI